MPTLLIVDKDYGVLPKGWVSAAMPDGVEPTDYEKSGRLWRAHKVGALPPALRKKDPPSFKQRALIFKDGEFIAAESAARCAAFRVANLGSSLTLVPGPEGLDRSHSTVWDYGPGRTYGSPQTALDALLSWVGPSEFAETHYARGWAGVYGQGVSGATLSLSTLSPTAAHPLVIDAEEGNAVTFDGEDAGACLESGDVGSVRVRRIKFTGALVGILPARPGSAVVRDWRIEECLFEGSPEKPLDIGVCLVNADLLAIRRCDFKDMTFQAAGTYAGAPNDYKTMVEMSGCRSMGGFQWIYNDAEVYFVLANNSAKANSFGVRHVGDKALILAGMMNNVLERGSSQFECIRADAAAEVRVLRSDGNCFHPGSSGAMAVVGGESLGLEEWRARTGTDQASLETDPLLDAGLAPRTFSPCLGLGRPWSGRGASGKTRAMSIDAGFEQVTEPRVPGAAIRRQPEIWRRK